jgi:hypothetical protein
MLQQSNLFYGIKSFQDGESLYALFLILSWGISVVYYNNTRQGKN